MSKKGAVLLVLVFLIASNLTVAKPCFKIEREFTDLQFPLL
jgi:hypothetical protein